MKLALDHLVINNHFALDATAQRFQALGFTLTPRGYHSLGSVNTLMMFGDHYLELVGLPVGGQTLRRELLNSQPGIDGLVFSSADAARTEAELRSAGFSVQPVQQFSREVVSGDERGEARFTTVRLAPDSFSAGRVYFCQHHTPEWVWRPEWLTHSNQVRGISALTLVARDADAVSARFRQLGKPAGDFRLDIRTYDDWHQCYGDLMPLTPERDSLFAAIHFAGGRLAELQSAAHRLALPTASGDGWLRVALPNLSLLLEFSL